jgi:hypothetical protein
MKPERVDQRRGDGAAIAGAIPAIIIAPNSFAGSRSPARFGAHPCAPRTMRRGTHTHQALCIDRSPNIFARLD